MRWLHLAGDFNNIGLPELVAKTVAQYMDIPMGLAQNPAELAYFQASLGPRMASAPLTDQARFVREMEEAYRAMWQRGCAKF